MKYARILNLVKVVLALSLVGCSKGSGSNGNVQNQLPPIGIPENSMVVKSRATLTISAGQRQVSLMDLILPKAHASTFVSVVNSPSSSLVIDDSNFAAPAISNAMLDFGTLDIFDLSDNDLDLCGVNGDQHCGTALIRMYTTGEAGEGLYNNAGGYGIPITAAAAGDTPAVVGLDPGNSAVIQTVTVPGNKHVISEADLAALIYNVQIDFSNAGAGAYQTTLVIEYVLAP